MLRRFPDPARHRAHQVRDDLHRLAQKLRTQTLLVKQFVVDLSGGYVGENREVLVEKTLVMTEIKIGFASVDRYEDFAVFQRRHRSGIYVQVGIEFEDRDL